MCLQAAFPDSRYRDGRQAEHPLFHKLAQVFRGKLRNAEAVLLTCLIPDDFSLASGSIFRSHDFCHAPNHAKIPACGEALRQKVCINLQRPWLVILALAVDLPCKEHPFILVP